MKIVHIVHDTIRRYLLNIKSQNITLFFDDLFVVYLPTYLRIRIIHFLCYISCIFLFPVAEGKHLLSNRTGDVRLPLINK